MSAVPSETIVDALIRRATDTPTAAAFVSAGEHLTYAGLLDDARELARRLSRLGLGHADRCCISLSSALDTVRVCYACQMLSAVPVLIDPAQWERVRERRVAAVGPIVSVSDHARPLAHVIGAHREIAWNTLVDLAPGDSAAQRAPSPADTAYLQFTSGSTGEAKAVIVTHRALAAALVGMRDRFDLTPDDRVAGRAPLHHSTGLVRYLFGTPWFGCVTHLLPPSASHVGFWLEAIAAARATITNASEFTYRVATEARMDALPTLRSLRVATCGGELVRAATALAFERRFGLSHVVQPAYGLSEATLIVSSGRPGDALVVDEACTVSCGRPMPGVDVRIAGADGTVLPAGCEGDIQVRGAQLFSGYFGDAQATADVLRDGWLSTGDVGCLDSAGRLFPRARQRALIKRGGVALAPREIEIPVEALPHVAGVAAVGVALPSGLTEDIVVVVETTATATDDLVALAQRVGATVREAVSARAGRVLLVAPDTLPRTSLGKVRHVAVREAVMSGALDARALHVS